MLFVRPEEWSIRTSVAKKVDVLVFVGHRVRMIEVANHRDTGVFHGDLRRGVAYDGDAYVGIAMVRAPKVVGVVTADRWRKTCVVQTIEEVDRGCLAIVVAEDADLLLFLRREGTVGGNHDTSFLLPAEAIGKELRQRAGCSPFRVVVG